MTIQRTAQINQQPKSEKPKGSGQISRTAVRSNPDTGEYSLGDCEERAISTWMSNKDFSQVPISTKTPMQFQANNRIRVAKQTIQAKLTLGQPGDKYEQEADRVAKEVVQRINTPQGKQASGGDGQPKQPETLQGRETESEEDVQLQQETGGIQRKLREKVQRKEAIGGGDVSTDFESALNSARGSGKPLDAGLQQSMGLAMGVDFTEVRVHTDERSDRLNQRIQAKAFTTGQEVFFRQGEYQPKTLGGQELIAHELTHVVQQNTSVLRRAGGVDVTKVVPIGQPGDKYEQEADRVAKEVVQQKNGGSVVHGNIHGVENRQVQRALAPINSLPPNSFSSLANLVEIYITRGGGGRSGFPAVFLFSPGDTVADIEAYFMAQPLLSPHTHSIFVYDPPSTTPLSSATALIGGQHTYEVDIRQRTEIEQTLMNANASKDESDDEPWSPNGGEFGDEIKT